jgi:hypothetical protein
MRSHLKTLVAGLMVLAGAAMLSRPAAAVSVSVKKPTVSPRGVVSTGGRVLVTLNVTVKGGRLAGMSLQANIPGVATGPYAQLSPGRRRGQYRAYVTVPANFTPVTKQATIALYARTSSGQLLTPRVVARVNVGPADDSLPPPPPPR